MNNPKEKSKPVSQEDVDFITDSKNTVMFSTPPLSRVAIYILLLFIVFAFFWARSATLDEVTVAQGTVIPSAHIQVIQSLEGGIIKAIFIHEGQQVKKGEPLLSLDETAFASAYRANLAKYESLRATNLRLQAQANMEKELKFPAKFTKQHPSLVHHETNLFNANTGALNGSLVVLKKSLSIAEHELRLTAPLVKKGLISKIDMLKTERELNDIRGKISEATSEFRKQAFAELNQNKAEIASLTESLKGLKDRMQRTVIRSPIDGIINNLQFNTIGGVIQPGIKILDIVPQEKKLLIEAKIRPSDIAFIHPNQKAIIKFTAYDFSIYGGLQATLISISPSTTETNDGETYYEAKLRADRNYLDHHGKHLRILPGMTVSVDILTGQKTVLDYLLKPILKTKQRAFRER